MNAWARAETLLRALTGAHPTFVPVQLLLGGVYANRGRFAEAAGQAETVLRLNDLEARAHLLLGMVAARQHRADDAVQSLHRALYLDDSLALAHFWLGNLYRDRGDIARACLEPATQDVLHRSLAGKEWHEVEPPAKGRVDERDGTIGRIHRPDQEEVWWKAERLVRVLECFGFDVVLLETVGAGQGDTMVRELVDVLVLLLQPETGDDLQWEKAGLLEVADLVVLHKADLPGAERAEAQVRAALEGSAGPAVPVLKRSAKTGEGSDVPVAVDHLERGGQWI